MAQKHDPIDQYLVECRSCHQMVCLVCSDLCHDHCVPGTAADDASASSHVRRPLGLVRASHCGCNKSTCRALSSIDPREAAGFKWTPRPISTRAVSLDLGSGTELGALVEKLAWNSHEVSRPESLIFEF